LEDREWESFVLDKVRNLIRLLKRLAALPEAGRVADSADLQKLVDFVDFKFSQSINFTETAAVAEHSGRTVRELLGHESLTISVQSQKPVAVDSLDHIHPWGTKQDNSKNLKFNLKILAWLPLAQLQVLDIGCSGGGFVRTMHDAGALAVGIEGSDYSRIRARAEWGTIPHRLFTADATAPFSIQKSSGETVTFTLITAWEFIEHIDEDRLAGVFSNIDRHLAKNGIVIMSVSPIDDIVDGVNLHRTVKPYEWWVAACKSFGFVHHPHAVTYFAPDHWIRFEENAAQSFHLVLNRVQDQLPPLPL
jgi:2-polyprenyl-3-methyl-5-hydroxy-6-metoxy-1,4-benzoquinol methylase